MQAQEEHNGKRLSLPGSGTMRLPTKPDGSIDEAQTAELAAWVKSL